VTLLVGQAGASVKDHAIDVDEDTDAALARALRHGYANRRALCGRAAQGRSRLFDPADSHACVACAVKTGHD
jgi:hypothetical protein